jgi:competence ComEA-like helix-hairpin-helix protein
MNHRILFFLALAMPASIYSLTAQDNTPDLPEGAGKALVAKTCTKCHGVEMFVAGRKTGREWSLIMDKMVEEGLEIDETNAGTILNYLATYLGKESAPAKVNVNKAAAKELEQALGLLDTEAEAIVKYRTTHGAFKDWRELTKVDGVDSKKIESHKDQIQL